MASKPPEPSSPVVIVGGGWAGLSAAIELVSLDIPVHLLEASNSLGGRARRVDTRELSLDNGQHLLLGAYREVLVLLQRIGVDPDSVLVRRSLELNLFSSRGRSLSLKPPALPAPLHLLWALLQCRGLSLAQRLRAIRAALSMAMAGFRVRHDQSLQDWLTARGQDADLQQRLWAPICIAALNTPIEQASVRTFLRVMDRAFAHRRSDSDMLLACPDLGAVLPEPARAYITRCGGAIQLGQRARRLEFAADALQGLHSASGFHRASHVILATPPHESLKLLRDHPGQQAMTAALARFQYEPICTVYLQYPPRVKLPREMQGLLNGPGQWAFDRSLNGQPGLMAVVISAGGAHMQWDNHTLADKIHRQLQELLPTLPDFSIARVIREKRATFRCDVGLDEHRPDHLTTLPGVWLAGDYTNTGYPATLEGAVLSGLKCARQVAEAIRSQ